MLLIDFSTLFLCGFQLAANIGKFRCDGSVIGTEFAALLIGSLFHVNDKRTANVFGQLTQRIDADLTRCRRKSEVPDRVTGIGVVLLKFDDQVDRVIGRQRLLKLSNDLIRRAGLWHHGPTPSAALGVVIDRGGGFPSLVRVVVSISLLERRLRFHKFQRRTFAVGVNHPDLQFTQNEVAVSGAAGTALGERFVGE